MGDRYRERIKREKAKSKQMLIWWILLAGIIVGLLAAHFGG